jgi:quercetin dioxygenase-like cupin family protein
MDATNYKWEEVNEDNPISLLTRRLIKGEKALVAQVKLQKGCHVALHHHVSEQISVHISGKALWRVGAPGSAEYREVEMEGGEVMILPSNVFHSVDAIEDTLIYDLLTPIGPMGVDSQKS